MSNDRTPFLLEGKTEWNEYIMSCEQDVLFFVAEEWLLILRAISSVDEWEIDENFPLKISSFLLVEKKIPLMSNDLIRYGKEIIFPYLSMAQIIDKINKMDICSFHSNEEQIGNYRSSKEIFWAWLFTK